MNHPRLKTHEELLGDLIDVFKQLLDDIEANQKELKLAGRTSDEAKAHRTRKRIRHYLQFCERRY